MRAVRDSAPNGSRDKSIVSKDVNRMAEHSMTIRSACIRKMPSQQSFGLINSKLIMHWYFIKIRLAFLPEFEIRSRYLHIVHPNRILIGRIQAPQQRIHRNRRDAQYYSISRPPPLYDHRQGPCGATVSHYSIRDYGAERLSF